MTIAVPRRPAALIGLTIALTALAGCQSTPVETTSSPSEATTSTPDTGNELDIFPAEVVLTCPEPEPVAAPPVVCPPIKPVKCPVCPKPNSIDGKMLIGAVEKVTFTPPGITFTARIDTGAVGSSIHARDITRFERDGDRWVRFTINDPDDEPVTLERKVVRRVNIKTPEQDQSERRPVVMMTVALGSLSEQIEMSLTDRSDMDYPVVIGRNLLKNNAVVDVSREFRAK
ncbi:MAG: hypothetical protein CMK32_10315 [Porticoccaceae bacterium]|nr:hypothetical protein [Porticoccaceae bacterium]